MIQRSTNYGPITSEKIADFKSTRSRALGRFVGETVLCSKHTETFFLPHNVIYKESFL